MADAVLGAMEGKFPHLYLFINGQQLFTTDGIYNSSKLTIVHYIRYNIITNNYRAE